MADNGIFSSDLERRARGLRLATLAALAVVAAVVVYAALAIAGFVGPGAAVQVTDNGAAAGTPDLVVAIASGLLFALGLWRLARMLRMIELGELFTRGTIRELRAFTFLVLASSIVAIILPIALSLIDALSAPAGQRRITVEFDGGDFFALLVSALLFFLARLLGEAQRIAEDSSQIV